MVVESKHSGPQAPRSTQPPRLARRLLTRVLAAPRGSELIDDLDEEYADRAVESGRLAAGVWYWGQALRPAVNHLGRELREVRTVRLGSHRAVGVAPLTWLGAVRRDLRTARRRLLRSPAFAASTVLTLGLAIGATVAIYSVVEGVVLRPLPYPAPDRLVTLAHAASGPINASLGQSYGTYTLYRDDARSLDGIAFYQTASATLTGDAEPERVEIATVTHTFFDLLRVSPRLGRIFREEEDRVGGPQVVLVSQRLWERRFGADPGLVGQTVEINGLRWEVIGIMPSSFEMPLPETDVWFPQQVDFASAGFGGFYLSGIGRLAAGVTLEGAVAELQSIADRIDETYPEVGEFLSDVDLRVVARPLHDHVLGGIQRTLWILFGGVGLLLLIACANVANLLLVRSEARSRELSLRRALGAGRRHLLGDSLAESLYLAAAGGAIGLVVGWLGVAGLGRLASEYIPRFDQVSVYAPALLVATAIGFVSCVLYGALPAVRGASASSVTTGAGRRTTADQGRTRIRHALSVTQIALALLLLVGAGLLARSYRELQRIEPGFEAEVVLTFELQLPGARYPSRADAAEAQALQGYAALKRGNWAEGIAALEAALADLQPFGTTRRYVHHFLRFEVGKTLLEAGKLREAERYFQSIVYPDFLRFTPAELYLGKVYEALDEPEKARHHYARFVDWWADADPELQPLVEEAREAFQRLAVRSD